MPTTPTPPTEMPDAPERPSLADLLADAGLRSLPPAELRGLATLVADVLTERVGARLVGDLTTAQVTEFELLTALEDERTCRAWLERTLPHNRDVVVQEVHDVVRDTAARVLAALAALSTDPPITEPVRGEAP